MNVKKQLQQYEGWEIEMLPIQETPGSLADQRLSCRVEPKKFIKKTGLREAWGCEADRGECSFGRVFWGSPFPNFAQAKPLPNHEPQEFFKVFHKGAPGQPFPLPIIGRLKV